MQEKNSDIPWVRAAETLKMLVLALALASATREWMQLVMVEEIPLEFESTEEAQLSYYTLFLILQNQDHYKDNDNGADDDDGGDDDDDDDVVVVDDLLQSFSSSASLHTR